ncbi:MAG: helix-turn-helix domain-containing protein [Haloarculaceae archaeon]
MKHVRLTARPDPERAPAFFRLLAASPHAREARLLEWNLGAEERVTLLHAVDGEPDAFRERATETPGIESVDVAETGGEWFFTLVSGRPSAVPLFRHVVAALTRAGLVVLTPVRYEDGAVEADIVGDPDALRATLEAVPDALDGTVGAVGPFRGPPEMPATRLSDRQREAAAAALDLGYYDRPSRATHEDVADAMGCAPSTASEHLKKAEATLVEAAMETVGR